MERTDGNNDHAAFRSAPMVKGQERRNKMSHSEFHPARGGAQRGMAGWEGRDPGADGATWYDYMHSPEFEAIIDKIFKESDKDASGTIEGNEMKFAMSKLLALVRKRHFGKCPQPKVSPKKMMKKFDVDKNGVLDREEFGAFCREYMRTVQWAGIAFQFKTSAVGGGIGILVGAALKVAADPETPVEILAMLGTMAGFAFSVFKK